MAKKNPYRKLIVALTIVIAIGAMATVTTLLIQVGVIDVGLSETPNVVPPLAEIPIIGDDPDETNPDNDLNEELGLPEGFIRTDEDILSAFLDTIGFTVTETFGVDATIRLIDANLEEVIQGSFLRVQPLDPTKVITVLDEEISALRLFINTDFSTQIADNGINYHRYSGWDVVNDFGNGASIPVSISVSSICSGVPNTGKCIKVSGSKNDDDDTANGSRFHGISKEIDISDWTKEGDLFVGFDYSCNQNFLRNAKFFATVEGDFGDSFDLPCLFNQKFSMEVSDVVGNSNTITFAMGAQARNVDKFRMDILFNNAFVAGNSVIKRDAIEALQSFSIVQNDQEQRILDLGFIETSLIGKTVFANERVVVNGKLETRIDDKTITVHDVTGNGVTVGNTIGLRIDGQDTFIFELQKQFFDPETFHKFNILLNDFIVTVGEGAESRTFEYHTPFVIYSLEFNVTPEEIVAFNAQDQAISVLKSDTTFVTCGLTSGEDLVNEPEVLPPVVSIISNGFTIATTNPSAGKVQATDPFTRLEIPNTEFCSTITDLPRQTDLTFRIENSFLEVSVPATQQNYFVKCVREGCTSNIGYVSDP